MGTSVSPCLEVTLAEEEGDDDADKAGQLAEVEEDSQAPGAYARSYFRST
jgi:hypothetical protein